MEVKAHIKYVRISPLKLRTLIDSLKSMTPRVALDHLGLSKKRSSKMLYKAIKSAVSNGLSTPGFDPEKASFAVLSVDEGPVYKRFRAGSRGMARPYVRKSSHITVVLTQKGLAKAEKAAKVSKAPAKSALKDAQSAATTAAVAATTAKPKADTTQKPSRAVRKSVTNMQRTTHK